VENALAGPNQHMSSLGKSARLQSHGEKLSDQGKRKKKRAANQKKSGSLKNGGVFQTTCGLKV
jgi:hypothetical protein